MAVYANRDEHRANQGDVFADVPFMGDRVLAGMITSHDCVCDKYLDENTSLAREQLEVFVVSVAPVHGIDLLSGSWQAAVRADKMPRYFHLPAEAGIPELVADLYHEQPVRFAAVLEGARLSSLSQEALGRLYEQFMRLRFGREYMRFCEELVTRED